jgi:hypothetical protein
MIPSTSSRRSSTGRFRRSRSRAASPACRVASLPRLQLVLPRSEAREAAPTQLARTDEPTLGGRSCLCNRTKNSRATRLDSQPRTTTYPPKLPTRRIWPVRPVRCPATTLKSADPGR